MQLAINHIEEMLNTHRPNKIEKMVLMVPIPIGQGVPFNLRQDRKIYIQWAAGPGMALTDITCMEEYEKQGYRCVDVSINGITSCFRLVKGKLSAVDEYRLYLESRVLTSFEYNADSSMIEMEFVERYPMYTELSAFEKKQLAFLNTIKKADLTFTPEGAFIQIESHYLTEQDIADKIDKEIKNAVNFTLKDVISADQTIEERINKYTNDREAEALRAYGNPGDMARKYATNEQIDNIIKSEGWPTEYTVPSTVCPDCTDGFYTPFLGPREACQTCKVSNIGHSIDPVGGKMHTYVQTVTDQFVEGMTSRLPSQVKMSKNVVNQWIAFTVDLTRVKGYSTQILAHDAARQIVDKIRNRFLGLSVAFDDQNMYYPPPTKEGQIHKRHTNSIGVSASVSMQDSGHELQYQFQVKVST